MTTLVEWLENEVTAGDTAVQVWVDRARAAEKELKDTKAKLAAAVKMQEGYYKENKQLKRRLDSAKLDR